MKQEHLEEILEHQGYGIAVFSSDLDLVRCNIPFKKFCLPYTVPERAKVGDTIPETIGLEEVLKGLPNSEEKYFILENINRKLQNSQTAYFNLYFYSFKDRKVPLLCLVRDVTSEAQQRQQINQQKYELRLLEGLLTSQRGVPSQSILGDSEPIRKMRSMIEKVSGVPVKTVLLQGEAGTGKKLAAKVIHYSSKSAGAPFVELNSAAIPESQLESELFGYEQGAFDHATTSRRGLIEEADGGTLFLDEIGELSPNLQAKLLSFLESSKFRRIGSNQEREAEVRLIAATNRNLKALVEKGNFRKDLYDRLSMATLPLPPLRELEDDILIIAEHFVRIYNSEFKKRVKGFTESAEQVLLSHLWPGNVRELANCIERAMIFIDKDRIDSGDLLISLSPDRE